MEFSVKFDLSEVLASAQTIRINMLGDIATAVEGVATTGLERWQTNVMKAPLWQGEKDAYVATIRAERVDDYHWEIRSNYRYVEDIESGRPPRDLKLMLNTSMKTRVSKDGRRYMIVPFRHNTPGYTAHAPAMPKDVYAQARKLEPSIITGHGHRVSGTGAYDIKTKQPFLVRQRQYQWGGRLGADPNRRMGRSKTDRYAGMVRFNTSSGKQSSSSYLTFRVMMEGSLGWIIPARPGLWIAKHVAESLQAQTGSALLGALSPDLT